MTTFKELFRRLPNDGVSRHKLREFNLSQKLDGKAQSVKDLAVSLGFTVSRQQMKKGLSGFLRQDPFASNGYEIVVNQRESVESQRWSLLHEMGHFFLHSKRSDPLADPLYLNRASDAFYVDLKQEKEANQFAAVLLFGDGVLAASVILHGRDPKVLARIFGVSEKTVEIAIKQFLM